MSMPGYGPWARLANFRGSSEKGERVRGLIVQESYVPLWVRSKGGLPLTEGPVAY